MAKLADAIMRGLRADQPAAGTEGRLYYVTDENVTERDSGLTWEDVSDAGGGGGGGGSSLDPDPTPMVSADFAWINQGGASVNVLDSTVFLASPTGDGMRIRKKAAPSTPYVITVQLRLLFLDDVQLAGLVFRESSSGKLHPFYVLMNTTGLQLSSAKWSDENSFSAGYSTTPSFGMMGSFLWLRIADNGTNRICSFSMDGRNFVAFHSVGRTDFLTANEVGILVNPNTSGLVTGMTVYSWAES